MVGDVLWPLLAILGVSWVVGQVTFLLIILRWVAAGMFVVMGILLIRKADAQLGSDSRLTRPGMWAGFVAGLLVILGNPKAILFYMGVLPGFFDLSNVTVTDIALICFVSLVVPLLGNLIFATFVGRIRAYSGGPDGPGGGQTLEYRIGLAFDRGGVCHSLCLRIIWTIRHS